MDVEQRKQRMEQIKKSMEAIRRVQDKINGPMDEEDQATYYATWELEVARAFRAGLELLGQLPPREAALTKVRAKMVVNMIQDYGSTMNYQMGCVYSQDPNSENGQFSEASPSGYFSLSVSKGKASPAVHEFLAMALNDEVYLDITRVPSDRWRYCLDRMPPVNQTVLLKGPDGVEVTGVCTADDPKDQNTYNMNLYLLCTDSDGITTSKIGPRVNGKPNPFEGWYWKLREAK